MKAFRSSWIDPILGVAYAVAIAFAVCLAPTAALAADTRPNIVLFLADDMGIGDTSALQLFTGNADARQIRTPNMERIAESGIRFTDAHSPGANCRATRYHLMRGGRPSTGGWQEHVDTIDRPLPAMLARGGYRTYGVGKWHLPYKTGSNFHVDTPIELNALDFGFDHYTGVDHNIKHTSHYHSDRRVMRYDARKRTLVPNRSAEPPGYDRPGGPHASISQQIWLDYARSYMARHRKGGPDAERPFFLYYSSHANHREFHPPEQIDGISLAEHCKTADGRPIVVNRDGFRAARARAVCENDLALGLLLDWLDRTDDPRQPGRKMSANTLVVFTSDNGANAPQGAPAHGPLRGDKGVIREGGHRVPFVVTWGDRLKGGAVSKQTISLSDLFATFASVAQTPLEEDEALDSFDVMDSILHPERTEVRPVFAVNNLYPTAVMLRLGPYKLVWDGRSDTANHEGYSALFDLSNDIGERRNLLDDPALEKTRLKLYQAMHEYVHHGRSRPASSKGS